MPAQQRGQIFPTAQQDANRGLTGTGRKRRKRGDELPPCVAVLTSGQGFDHPLSELRPCLRRQQFEYRGGQMRIVAAEGEGLVHGVDPRGLIEPSRRLPWRAMRRRVPDCGR